MPIFDEIHLKFLQIIIPFAVISLSVLVSIISYFVNQKIVRSRYRKALYEEIYFNYGLINNCIPELPVKDEQILVPISRSFMAASWLFSFDIYDALKAKLEFLRSRDISMVVSIYIMLKNIRKMCLELEELLKFKDRDSEQQSQVASTMANIMTAGVALHGIIEGDLMRSRYGRNLKISLSSNRGLSIKN